MTKLKVGLYPVTTLIWLCLLISGLTTSAVAGSPALNTADARHLLTRTGLGVDYRELLFLTGKTRTEAINYIIDGFNNKPTLEMPPWTQQPAPLYWTREDLPPDNRLMFDRRRDAELIELRQWWVDNMLASSSPQTERMVLFWHNHFATSYYGINRQTKALALQNTTFRTQAIGNFRQLLKSMIRDPALLNYLDNLSNRKNSPNENLARELLELFTMGEGQYDQSTVREAARTLTGHGVSQNQDLTFEFKTWNHDTTQKKLFGQTANHSADDLIDLILQQPAVAVFIATKFWHAFISDYPPTTDDLASLAKRFRDSDYDLAALYRATLESDSFWHSTARASLIKSPAQLIIGAARTLQYPSSFNHIIPSLLARSGMNLFAPPNVAGWPQGESWITPGRLLNRQASLDDLLQHELSMRTDAKTDKHRNMSGNSMSGNSMSNNMMMSDTIRKEKYQPAMQLHLAAENYRGAAQYQIELHGKDQKLLWQQSSAELTDGHDTAMFGRIKNVNELPWQVVDINAPTHILNQAEFVRVHFINDGGGNDGDRNLFVNGATVNNNWFDSSQGHQQGKCPPQSAYNAGRLYCEGFVDIAIQSNKNVSDINEKKPAAASVHVNWVRAIPGQLDLTLTLQDFYTDDKYYPTFSFHLKSQDNNLPRLELDSYGCFPDCLSQWPSCAWESPPHGDKNNHKKTLAFQVEGPGNDKTLQCHYNAATRSEKTLISSLFVSALTLTEQAFDTARDFNPDQRSALKGWQHLLQSHSSTITERYSTAGTIAITAHLKRQETAPQAPFQFQPGAGTPEQLEHELSLQNLTLADVLLPGIPVSALPELKIASATARSQLRAIISHPVFHLH